MNFRLACTVVVVRDGADGLEALLLKRDPAARFLPGFHVFPGGAIGDGDRDPLATSRVVGMDDAAASRRLELPDGALAFWLAAVRETFEECGLVLAVDEAGGDLDAGRLAAMLAERTPVHAGALPLATWLERHRLVVPARSLVYFDHWLTPPTRSRRFDTRFFLTRAPEGQDAVPDGAEMVDARWMRPAEALAGAARGTIEIANATSATLRGLAQHRDVDDALAAARAVGPIEANRPCVAQGRDGPRTFYRDDAAYAEIRWSDPSETMLTTYELAPGVPKRLDAHLSRIVAPNGGTMTGPGTNSYFVGGRDLVLIDPGPLDDRHVAALLAHGDGRIRWIACTHTHRDHSPAAAAIAAATGAQVIGMPAPPGPRQDSGFAPGRVPRDGEALEVGGTTLRAIHTPGHASNHLCYLDVATGMLFTGDHVMQGTTVVIPPPDGNMRHYLASLERLLALDLAIIAPGHGYLIGRPHREIRRLIEHRRWREARVLDAVARRGPASVEELLDDVYPDVPAPLRGPAARSLEAHLVKLREDGAVDERAARYALRASG